MDTQRVCGTCLLGGEAYDRYGQIDPNYVICQIKEAENRKRKPDRFQVTSGVSRMHYQREACIHWEARTQSEPLGETDLHLYDPAFHEWAPPPPMPLSSQTPKRTELQEGQEQLVNTLKLQAIQQDQMIASLQRQNLFLSEQVTELQAELKATRQKLESLKPFDPAIFSEVNYFSLLGIQETAESAEIKEAYRQRMKFLHPDRYLNISQRLNTAYETLMDPQKRKQYLHQIKGSKHA